MRLLLRLLTKHEQLVLDWRLCCIFFVSGDGFVLIFFFFRDQEGVTGFEVRKGGGGGVQLPACLGVASNVDSSERF